MRRVWVVGGAVLDVVFELDAWPQPQSIVHAQQIHLIAGGKGLNQAVAAQRLGASSALIACIGEDRAAEYILAALRQYHICGDFVRINPQMPTNTVGVLVHDGEPSFVGMTGANHTLTEADLAPFLAQLTPEDVVMANYEVLPLVAYAALIGAKARGATTIFNPAPLYMTSEIPTPPYEAIDVLIPNIYEASVLLQQPHIEPAAAVRQFLARGVKTVILTLGAEGCLFAQENTIVQHQPAFPIEVVDTTGASDAFCALLAAEWGKFDMAELVRRASAASALTCQKIGAIPAMPDVTALTNFLQLLS